jgi:hypothetical protein
VSSGVHGASFPSPITDLAVQEIHPKKDKNTILWHVTEMGSYLRIATAAARLAAPGAYMQVIQVKGLLHLAQVDATEPLAPQELHTLVGHNDVVLRG